MPNNTDPMDTILKKKEDILNVAILGRTRGPWIEALLAYLIISLDELKTTTEKSSKTANRLSCILIWLTAVLALGSAVGAIATIKAFF